MKRNNRPMYLNKKQSAFLQAKQKTRVFIGGRGTGKSSGLAISSYSKVRVMPRGRTFLAAQTYRQLLSKTLPACEPMWNRMGLEEGIHYVVGQKPPAHFDKPLAPTKKYDNVISWVNGHYIELLSMDNPRTQRGGSFDGGEIDEFGWIKEQAYNDICVASLRGNVFRFKHTHLHQNISAYSSMPRRAYGMWILDFKEKAKAYPKDYFYMEATAYDNVDILTAEGIERMRREMSYLEFMIEVMNERILQTPDGFYNKFSERQHVYEPQYIYGSGPRGYEVRGSADVRREELLEMSLDFSGWFNCATVWQEQDFTEFCLRQFHVKGDNKLHELIEAFCDHFEEHEFKFVRLWGEPRGHDKQPLTPSIFESIKAMLEKRGWQVEIMVQPGRTRYHVERHHFVNDVFAEQNAMLPKVRFNQDYCTDVIIALQVTEITPDFKKNKSMERNREFPQEHAPHYTDTVDYYLMQKHAWRAMDVSSDNEVVFLS